MGAYSLKKSAALQLVLAVLLVLTLAAPVGAAGGKTFSSIVVFGDSLSDPGNAFALRNALSTPPYATLDALLIPEAPYAKGGHHFSNGATWIEQFARPRGLAGSVRPAFQGSGTKATNYAVGGARAYEDGKNANLSIQVSAFLSDVAGRASSEALYVIEIGGNDVRDALAAAASGGNPGAIINEAVEQIGNTVATLHAAGARKFLVWNTPNLKWTPAIRMLDSIPPGGAGAAVESLGSVFNYWLDTVLVSLSVLPGIEIKRLDAFKKINDLVTDPEAYGLDVVDAACVTPNIPPFDCKKPDDYLFWDGIHPTGVVHGIFAQEAAAVLLQ
jgi:phospholipase/lecithinase/hemolysin